MSHIDFFLLMSAIYTHRFIPQGHSTLLAGAFLLMALVTLLIRAFGGAT